MSYPMDLDDRARHYLAARGHTLSTAHLTGWVRVSRQAKYVAGEVAELMEAVGIGDPDKVRAELADCVLALTFLADALHTTPERCIDYKTELDAGRG